MGAPRYWQILPLLILTGCAAETISTGMKTLVGQPIEAAIQKLGLPGEEHTVAGHKVYVWFSRSIQEGTERKCQIRAIMNGDLIGSFDWEGNNFYCLGFASQHGL